MTTRNIDEQIRIYYAEEALSAQALERLRGLVKKSEAPTNINATDHPRALRMWQTVALAASLAVAFLAGTIFLLREPKTVPIASQGLSETIANEVAARHHRCVEEITFTAADLDELYRKMENLDFKAVVPDTHGIRAMKLKGAHYCVVDGQLALHAVLVDEKGEICSLFETRASDRLASLRQAKHVIKGTEVDLWQSGDVLVAVATTTRS